ncbi:unnamed protein product, partial [Scytosiphon promiscuus]
ERVFDSARRLRRCKSTPALSCTAVSLLSKTLNARATRLESTASRARLAAEKETYRRMTIAKRRRARGPKNTSEFMRQTIRDRENERGRNKSTCMEDKRTADCTCSLIQTNCSSNVFARPAERSTSKPAPVFPSRQSAHSPKSHQSPLTSEDGPQACDFESRSPPDKEERSSTHRPDVIPTSDRVTLEDDADVRVLLDRTQSSRSCTSSEKVPRPATSCGRRRESALSASSGPFARPRARAEPSPVPGSSSAQAHEAFSRRPHTAGAYRREISSEIDTSDMFRLRREMLIRSHGEGRNANLFAAKQFETTAMGRKKCDHQPRVRRADKQSLLLTPWIPASTLAGLDRIKRSRMLMNQRPVVSKIPSSWA